MSGTMRGTFPRTVQWHTSGFDAKLTASDRRAHLHTFQTVSCEFAEARMKKTFASFKGLGKRLGCSSERCGDHVEWAPLAGLYLVPTLGNHKKVGIM